MINILKKTTIPFLFLFPLGMFCGLLFGSVPFGILSMAVALIAWHKPQWVLLGLISIAPLSRSPQSQLILPETIAQAKTVLALILGGVWFLKNRLLREEMKFPTWIIGFLVLWLGLSLIAIINARDFGVSFNYFLAFLGGLFLFLITYKVNTDIYKKIFFCVAIITVLISFLSLIQYAIAKYRIFPFLWRFIMAPREQVYLKTYIPGGDEIYRSQGTFTHPNQLGAYLAFLIPFIISFLSVQDLSKKGRFLLVGLTVLLLLSLYTTNSRNSFLALAASLGFLSFHRNYRWLIFLFIFIVMVFIGAYVQKPTIVRDYIVKVTRIKSGLSYRKPVWKNSLELIARNPLLGLGPGNFSRQYVSHFGYFIFEKERELIDQMGAIQRGRENLVERYHAHNIYLQLAAEMGVLAPFLFLTGIILVVIHCKRRAWNLPEKSWGRALALGTASVTFGLIFYSMFESVIFTTLSLSHLAGPILAVGVRS